MKKVILLIVLYFWFIGSFAQSLQVVDSMVQVVNKAFEKEKPDKSDIMAAINLVDYYSKVSFDTAKIYGIRAFELSNLVGNDTGVAVSLNSIGMLYQSCGYHDSAFPYLDSAINMFIRMGDSTGLVFVRNNLAVTMMRRGNYAEALKYYQENLIIAENRNELENMVLSYNNIGITYYDWKKYDHALENYRKALVVLDRMGEEDRKGPVFNNMGEAYLDMGLKDTALVYFRKALKINNKYRKKRSILISMTNIGNIYAEDGNYKEAIKVYDSAFRISNSIPDNVNSALILIKTGNAYNKLGNYVQAYRSLNQGLNMSEENGMINSVLEAYSFLTDYALGINNADLLYSYVNRYIYLKDSLFNDQSLSEISELETKFKTVEKEKEIVELRAVQQDKDLEIQIQKNMMYTMVILLLVIILAGILIFNRYKLKKEKEKSEIEKERIRIEQRLLHSQMNPHFIFNSLNSINSFIGENNSVDAQTYLSKFASLMRLILENSRKVTVTLEDEIETLKLNLELEQLRFDGRFTFNINIASDIDNEEVFIPPMLIQPFVENAIKHGIKGKDGKGKIDLSFKIEDNILLCVVEDNGIGREAAKELSKDTARHNSLGMQVTMERLKILRTEKNHKAGFNIIDLKDNNGIGIGTIVKLQIPCEFD